jgi:hypothetical protein
MQISKLSVINLKTLGFIFFLSIINPTGIRPLFSQVSDDSHDKLISVVKFYGGEKREYEHKTEYTFSRDVERYSWEFVHDSISALGPFPGLTKMEFPGGSIYYRADISVEINKLYRNLDPRDPLFDSTSAMADDPVLIKSPITAGSDEKFIFAFTWGPSDDFSFDIYRDDRRRTRVGSMGGYTMYVPGNGYVYVEGHTNNAYNHRKKYKFENRRLVEARQAFYYVGLKTYITAPMKLYTDTAYTEVVASLMENQPVEVLIAIFNKRDWSKHDFLLRTPFGLTGWIRISNTYPRTNIKGIFYAGD